MNIEIYGFICSGTVVLIADDPWNNEAKMPIEMALTSEKRP